MVEILLIKSNLWQSSTWKALTPPPSSTLISLLPMAMPISARSLSSEDIISVTLFLWWLDISFSFWSSESRDDRMDCRGREREHSSFVTVCTSNVFNGRNTARENKYKTVGVENRVQILLFATSVFTHQVTFCPLFLVISTNIKRSGIVKGADLPNHQQQDS